MLLARQLTASVGSHGVRSRAAQRRTDARACVQRLPSAAGKRAAAARPRRPGAELAAVRALNHVGRARARVIAFLITLEGARPKRIGNEGKK